MAIAVEPDEQEPEVLHVLRNPAVEDREQLQQNEENIDRHGVGDDDAELADGFFAGVERGQPPQQQTQQDQQRRARGECRGQEARRQDGRQPEGAARQAAIEKRRHRVNGDGPRNREQ